jgi:hypothetical protein
MSFGTFETIPINAHQLAADGTVLATQRDTDGILLVTAEALGQGGTAFSLLVEVSLDGGATFKTIAVASVSDFAPPNMGGRRQSLSLPVPAKTQFRLRIEPVSPVSLASPEVNAFFISMN